VPVCYRHPERESHIRCQRCNRPICPDCMRDAAVGFQCPACVAEGAKSTRSGRTAYGGQRPTNPGLTSIALIGINVFVWVMVLVTGWQQSRLIELLGLRPNGLCAFDDRGLEAGRTVCGDAGGIYLPGVADNAYWQLITSAFMHEQIWHIGFNMLALWILGPQLELAFGRVRFLALYLISALAGSALVYWAAPEYQLTIGASGAIFGLLGALLVVAFKVGGNVQQLLILLGINAVITLTIPNVSWQGHLGGLLGGVLVAVVLVYAPRTRRAPLQAAGLVAITLVLALAVVLRTVVLA